MTNPLMKNSLEEKIETYPSKFPWVWGILLLGVLMAGAYFRFIGINWDQNQHLHPDERFMTMVASSISFPDGMKGYFNTDQSSLNPNNRGYGFYVYGTLPLFMVRFTAELLDKTGYDQIFLVGRALSGVVDLLTVILVYLIAMRLFKNHRLALIAAAFSAFSVLPIQLSHYFTVDTFTNFFTFLAFFLAVWILTGTVKESTPIRVSEDGGQPEVPIKKMAGWKRWLLEEIGSIVVYALFGAALGMALASKISAVPLALLLPGAAYLHYLRVPERERPRQMTIILRNLALAALVSFVVFRVSQPYAFKGPSFFGVIPNEKWVNNLKDLSAQSNGDVDFPPALQWARRPIWFSLQNMALWGLGLPLGMLGVAGFVWMAWRMFRGYAQKYALIWIWTAFYFVWQSLVFSRTMRYQLLIYPTLAIMAAWFVVAFWHSGRPHPGKIVPWRKVLAGVFGGIGLMGTLAWAFAFVQIYTQPITRVQASEWIYQNVPSAINLNVVTPDLGEVTQPLPFNWRAELTQDEPIMMAFEPQESGSLNEIRFAHIASPQNDPELKTMVVMLTDDIEGKNVLSAALLVNEFSNGNDPRGGYYSISFESPTVVEKEKRYYLNIYLDDSDQSLNISGGLTLQIVSGENQVFQPLADLVEPIRKGHDFISSFNAIHSGNLSSVTLPMAVDWEGRSDVKTLILTISGADGEVSSQVTSDFHAGTEPRGGSYPFKFEPPLKINAKQNYTLQLSLSEGEGAIAAYGSRQAIESSWDDSLPLPLDGYNPFDYESGVYRGELNFEMYWDDNQEKLERFETILDQADYIFISSNRQWGTTVRVPERYPLTTAYYRNLIGCPADQDILNCYRDAQPGMYLGSLGFNLEAVFQSEPHIGGLVFNSQYAEEAFSVYDHPKVLIFKKNASYQSGQVRQILGAVDLSQVVHVTPRKASGLTSNSTMDLMLPADRLTAQQAGGTWSDLYHRNSLINRFPGFGTLIWYLIISLMGLVVYPFIRFALRGLADHGYPFIRMSGMLLLAFLVWVAGSAQIPFTRITITIAFVLLALINGFLFWMQRNEILSEWREHWRYYLTVESIGLFLFVFFLLIRIGNPDLWHPYKGGEKPMDFSYLNAVLKSTSFPPYDPWFAGGYINYYYYGFVVAAVPVKWIGMIPSIAYNLILPTFFSLLGMGGFSIGWNLLSPHSHDSSNLAEKSGTFLQYMRAWIENNRTPLVAGLASVAGLILLGNLGTLRMIWQGFQRLVATGPIDEATWLQSWAWFFQGLVRFFQGAQFPYPQGDWYWIPSRAIPGEPITEFPLFTFLYADPHAHLFALPMTVLALGWALSVVKGRWNWGEGRLGIYAWVHYISAFVLGGVVIGALRPTNTWDLPTFLVIGVAAVMYAAMKKDKIDLPLVEKLPDWMARWGSALLSSALLVGLAFLFYQPFASWYGQGYNAIDLWKGEHTPVGSYFTHWGLFLFVIVSWLVWETIDWMEKTPLSALSKLKPFRALIESLLVILVLLVVGLLIMGVRIGWLALPLAAWAGVLLLRKDQSDEKRVVLFMIGSALILTLVVELIVLRGDIGRMNTVFKFYLQVWTLFALSSGAALLWLWPAIEQKWRSIWQRVWQVAFTALVFSAFLFTLIATTDKIRDRMSPQAPHTLDGMTYMAYSTYNDKDQALDLRQDYDAIRWMQDHVEGSPVIVECNTVEYRWGSRFTIYTGLPGVVGWNWHQRQQRAILPSEVVTSRVDEIGNFYASTSREDTVAFLQTYHVQYIIVGQLEEAYYSGAGLNKFSAWDGDLWQSVYHSQNTTIYRVNSMQ